MGRVAYPGMLIPILVVSLVFRTGLFKSVQYMASSHGVKLAALLSHQALQEQLTSVVQEIGHLIDPIATAARGEAAQLGHKVMCSGGSCCVHERGWTGFH